jgi:hypothetical protein
MQELRAGLRQNSISRPTADPPAKEVPTLNAFAPRFIDGKRGPTGRKPGGIAQKETVLPVPLLPHLGAKRLDAISTPKTCNSSSTHCATRR